MLRTIAIIVALVAAALGGYMLSEGLYGSNNSTSTTTTTAAAKSELPWVVAAPGRVEPGSGEFRLGAGILGLVADVPVKVNDKVEDGELIVRLDDEEARARLASAEAQEGLSRRERDAQPATSGREDVTKGEDGVYSSEREVTGARFELDAALAGKRHGEATDQQLADARKRLAKAQERVERERLAYAQAQAKSNLPTPNRFEVGADRRACKRRPCRYAARQNAHPCAPRRNGVRGQCQEGRDRIAVTRSSAGGRRRHVGRQGESRGRRRRRRQD